MNNCLLCNDGHVDFELKVKESNLVLSTLLKLYGKPLSKAHGLHHLFETAKVCSKCIAALHKIGEYFEEIERIRSQIQREKEILQNNLIDCRSKHSETEEDYQLRNIFYDVISEEQNSSSILGNLNRAENEEDCEDDSMIQSDAEHDVIVLDSDNDGDGVGDHNDLVKGEIFVNDFVDCSMNDSNITTTTETETTSQNCTTSAINESMSGGEFRKTKQCPLCSTHLHPVNLNRHLRLVHRELIPQLSRKRSSSSTLHKTLHKTFNKNSNVIKKYLCTKCTPNKIYSFEWNLRRHFRVCHQNQKSNEDGTTPSPSSSLSISKTTPISFLKVVNPNPKRKLCPDCSNYFSSAKNLSRHMKTMHGETRKKYICLMCNPEPDNLTSYNGNCSSLSSVKRHFVNFHKMKDLESTSHLYKIIYVPRIQTETETGAEAEEILEYMGDGGVGDGVGDVIKNKNQTQCPLCPRQLHPLSLNRHIRIVHQEKIDQDQNQSSQDDQDDASMSESAAESFMVTIEPTPTVILDSLNQVKNEMFFDESAEDHFIEDNTCKPIEEQDQDQDPFENF